MPDSKPSLAFFGAGRLANALARRLFDVGYRITGVTSRNNESAQKLASAIDSVAITDLPQADIVFLTVPDDEIADVVQQLSENNDLPALVHTSGVHSIDVFAPLSDMIYGSLHPLYPFHDGTQLRGDEGMLVAIEAPSPTLQKWLFDIAHAIGGIPTDIQSDKKILYHAAAVMASNYLVTLFDMSLNLMLESGVPRDLAQQSLANIMAGNVDNLRKLDPSEALTGPIARGDSRTLAKHLSGLVHYDYTKTYKALGQLTAALAPNLTDSQRTGIFEVLKD